MTVNMITVTYYLEILSINLSLAIFFLPVIIVAHANSLVINECVFVY